MTDYFEEFELVLYYNRRTVIKPTEPVFEEIKKNNPNLSTDQLLDLFTDLKNKYKKDLERYEKNKDKSVVECFVRFPSNSELPDKVRDFEEKDFFIEWSKESKSLINNTMMNLFK
jgi:hypothetical protein